MECFGEKQLGRMGRREPRSNWQLGSCIGLTFLRCVFSNGEHQLGRRGRREQLCVAGTSCSAIREPLCVWARLTPVRLSVELCEHKNLMCS